MEVISRIETFQLRIPHSVPYLGQLEEGVDPNARWLYVRPRNRIHDCGSVRLTHDCGPLSTSSAAILDDM